MAKQCNVPTQRVVKLEEYFPDDSESEGGSEIELPHDEWMPTADEANEKGGGVERKSTSTGLDGESASSGMGRSPSLVQRAMGHTEQSEKKKRVEDRPRLSQSWKYRKLSTEEQMKSRDLARGVPLSCNTSPRNRRFDGIYSGKEIKTVRTPY